MYTNVFLLCIKFKTKSPSVKKKPLFYFIIVNAVSAIIFRIQNLIFQNYSHHLVSHCQSTIKIHYSTNEIPPFYKDHEKIPKNRLNILMLWKRCKENGN